MARLDADVKREAVGFLLALSRYMKIRAVYLFGSRAEGTAHPSSDIDLGIFVDDLDRWTLRQLAKTTAGVQKVTSDLVEAHYFASDCLSAPDPATFAGYVIENGSPIPFEVDRRSKRKRPASSRK